jgi:HopJ type III effector protein
MMAINTIIQKIKNEPDTVTFSEIISCIDENYIFTPTAFQNGDQYNEAGQNNGSCKVFSFAKLYNLSVAQTLACFGDYYRVDVLNNLDGSDHQNIRNFIVNGWGGVKFESEALTSK